jgi:hypothetical protein
MSKRLDLNKVDAALKRAAHAAMSGARDERAGRLVFREADSGRFLAQNKKVGASKTTSGSARGGKRS